METSTLIGLGAAAGSLIVGARATRSAYSNAMGVARDRICASRSNIMHSRFGDLEYADTGSGAPILMIHGTGGGFDRGLFSSRWLLDLGYRIIAPSRFGYLRSASPDNPSSENQADAFADLLDELGIERIAVASASAGARSALAFATRHPDRCAALLPIVPAIPVPGSPLNQPWLTTPKWLVSRLLNSSFLLWAAIAALPNNLTRTLLATNPALVGNATTEEKTRVRNVALGVLPLSDRKQGLLNDLTISVNPETMDLKKITAPTLAIALEDDGFGTAKSARYIAENVRDTQLVIYRDGGHLWIGHDQELFTKIDTFLREIGYS